MSVVQASLMASLSDCWIEIAGTNVGAAAVRERVGVAGRDEADDHRGRAGLGGPLDLEADRAGAAVDERDLAGRIGEIRVLGAAVLDGIGRAALADVGDVAGEPGTERRPVEHGSVFGYEPAIDAGAETTSGNATALGTCVWATDSAVLAFAGVPAMYGQVAAVAGRGHGQHAEPRRLSTASDRSSSNASP